jgi:flavin-binding protein dodecin
MADSVYKIIELTGTSAKSIEDAVQTAISTAGKSVRNMCWFEVAETRGRIKDNKVAEFQVTIKVGFKIEK